MNNNHDYLSTFVPEKLSDLIKDNIIVSNSKNLSILSFNCKQSITVRIEKIGIMSYRKW